MNVNINNKNLFSQSLLINKFFFQKNFSHKQTGITTVDSGCQYRNNNYYYNKDGVPFLSKDQADRCINGKDWKKIVSVSDKVKSDLEKVVKQDFISSNGAYIPEESKRHDVIHFLRREMLDFTAFPVFFVSNLLLVQRKKYYFNRATVSRNCSIVL